jgi:ATP adenylyltransferase
LLIAPQLHKARLDQLSSDEHLEIMQAISRLTSTLERLMNCDGFNIGLNLGKVAGAGVPGHLHWHLVPRWHGDTNFMPVLADTNVIPQSLEALFELLHAELGGTP